MLVGDGLIAKAFKHYTDNSKTTVFASGVSNSKESDVAEYEREFNLLRQYVSDKSKFIYFSTCSVLDESLKESSYVKHKLKIEKYIAENFYSFIIFRLPIVVGNNSNPHTLTNFLFNKITNEENFILFNKAHRYLMDVEDLSLLLSGMINSGEYDNKTLDICLNNSVSIIEIVSIFEKILKKKAVYDIKECGGFYKPNNIEFINYLKKTNYIIKDSYNMNLIKKYYQNRC